MILANLSVIDRYFSLNPNFEKFFNFVKEHDLSSLPNGRNDIDGDNVFVNIVELDGKLPVDQVLEVHRDYIDVHIPFNTVETIGWKHLEDCYKEIKTYEADGDCALYADTPSTYVQVLPKECLIVFPEDAHAPAIATGKIFKAIGKIMI